MDAASGEQPGDHHHDKSSSQRVLEQRREDWKISGKAAVTQGFLSTRARFRDWSLWQLSWFFVRTLSGRHFSDHFCTYAILRRSFADALTNEDCAMGHHIVLGLADASLVFFQNGNVLEAFLMTTRKFGGRKR